MKIQVPDDLSLMGFNHIFTTNEEYKYHFTSMFINSYKIGKMLADSIIELTYTNTKKSIKKNIDPEIFEAGSVKHL